MLANVLKRPFSTIMDPASLLFKHKREINKYNAVSTLMKPPKNIVEVDISKVSINDSHF